MSRVPRDALGCEPAVVWKSQGRSAWLVERTVLAELASGGGLAGRGIPHSFQLILPFNKRLTEHLLRAEPCSRGLRYQDEARSAQSWLSRAPFTVGVAGGAEQE